MAYFSNYFGVDKELLDSYGAVDISLDCDSHLFIDPCLIYANNEYKNLHKQIVDYFLFLKHVKSSGASIEEFSKYCNFHEVINTWLGFSKESNKGKGSSTKFTNELYDKIDFLFNSKKSDIHIEKVLLFSDKTNCDKISDLITNIIFEFLCNYTMEFVTKYIPKSDKICNFEKIKIKQIDGYSYTEKEKDYILPYILKIKNYKKKASKTNKEFVLLVPKKILRSKKLEIDRNDFMSHFDDIDEIVDDKKHRSKINDFLETVVSEESEKRKKKLTIRQENKIKREHFYSFAKENPIIFDYYIAYKEKPVNIKNTILQSSIEYDQEIAKTTTLATDFLNWNKIYNVKELNISEFINMIKRYFSEENDNIKYVLENEQDLYNFFNHIAFNTYGKSCSKIFKNNLMIKFSRNFIRNKSTTFDKYLSTNKQIILFCTSEDDKKKLINFLHWKQLTNEINQSIYIIKYYLKK